MLFNLTHYGLLKISGIDAKKLLQGQVTCNIEELNETQSNMGALCNPQGRVISLFHVFYFKDSYYLLMPKNLIPTTLVTLKKYAVFYKAELSDTSQQFTILGCDDFKNNTLKNINVRIPINHNRYFLICERLVENIENNELHWKIYNINENIPTIYPETIAKFLPHDINLHQLGAISFNKGCYTGQEIIARMHYRGKLKNHLYSGTIKSATPLSPGENIYCLHNQKPQECGMIIDAYLAATDVYHALIVTDENSAQTNRVFLQHNHHHFFMIE